MSAPEGIVVEKFKDFVDLRRTGTTREEAWNKILGVAGEFDRRQIGSLLTLAKEWEIREGYKYRQKQGLYMTMLEPEPSVSSLGSGIRRISPVGNLPTQAAEIPEVTTGVPTLNVTTETSKSYFGEKSTLFLYFRGHSTPQQITVPAGKEMIIGRLTNSNPMAPDIDLEKLKGSQFGVSRIHASIQRRDNTLMVSDLGSRNFTLINGERIHPQELRVINDGDELCFGSLQVKVRFHHS